MERFCFDSNVCVGKRGVKHPLELWKTEDVLRVMDQCAVNGALVHSGWAKDYAPKYGNERLVEELKKSPRLFGCYTIMPEIDGDFASPEGVIKDIREKGMVAAKMFPKTHYFSADERGMGGYYRALEAAGIPLLVDYGEIAIDVLSDILGRHPKLQVLLQGTFWNFERMIHPLMREYSNLHIEFSKLQSNYAPERMVKLYGADRLLFGSGMPQMSLGAARSFFDYADISEADKGKILGGNLARLCRVKPPEIAFSPADEIEEKALMGKAQSVLIFDSHTHFLEDGGNCGGSFSMPRGDLENMEKLNARIGVDRSCVAPWLAIWTDSEAGNAVTAEMARRSEKVVPYVLIDPNYVTDVGAEARKYHLVHKFPGMKMFYERTRVRYNDPVYDSWWELANDNRLFALLDCGSYPQYLSDVAELAEKYSSVSIFLDHAGRSFSAGVENAEYAKKYPNLYLQLTYTSVTQGIIEYFVSEGLEDKVLYGTDAPMRDPRPQLGWVAFANIPIIAKRKILGENMQRILDRCFPRNI